MEKKVYLKISTYNNNFGAKIITEGFGTRSKDAKRWANIAELFERESIMYPSDELRITTYTKENYWFEYKINNDEYHGSLNKKKYKEFMSQSDKKIAEDFVRFNEIQRNVKMLLENSKEKIQSIVNLFSDPDIKNEVRCRIYSVVREFSKEQGHICKCQKGVLANLYLRKINK